MNTPLTVESYQAFLAAHDQIIEQAIAAAPAYAELQAQHNGSRDSRGLRVVDRESHLRFDQDSIIFSEDLGGNGWPDWESFSVPLAFLVDSQAFAEEYATARKAENARHAAQLAEQRQAAAREVEENERQQLAKLQAKYGVMETRS
jgi:signal transduction histidine kinase